jgi:hypothetical protein
MPISSPPWPESGPFQLDFPQRLDAVHAGHHDIEYDDVEGPLSEQQERFLSAADPGDLESSAFKALDEGFHEIRLVIHNQHLGPGVYGSDVSFVVFSHDVSPVM